MNSCLSLYGEINLNTTCDKVKIQNSQTLVIFIYLKYIISILFLMNNTEIVEIITMLATIVMLIRTIKINNFKFNRKFIFFFLSMIILYLINMSVVAYKFDIIEMLIKFLGYNVIIVYVILSGVNYNYILIFWHKIAKYTTVVVFIFYILGITKNIDYMFLGIYNAYNALIVFYYLFKEKKLTDILLVMPIIVLGLNGNRSALLTVALSIVIGLMFSLNKRKRIVVYLLLFLLLFLIIINMEGILEILINTFDNISINSYSIRKIRQMLQGKFWEMSSGRDKLYRIAIDIIKDSKGLPRGIGYFEQMTDHEFEYPHNFFLDLFIIIGIYFGIVFIFWFLIKIQRFIIFTKRYERDKLVFFSLILIFFITRTMFSSTFLIERSFWIVMTLLLSNNNRNCY